MMINKATPTCINTFPLSRCTVWSSDYYFVIFAEGLYAVTSTPTNNGPGVYISDEVYMVSGVEITGTELS